MATALSLNESSTGHLGYYSLGYSDPVDWWEVTVPTDGKLIIATLSDPTLEIDNYIYDQNRTTQIAAYAYGGSHVWDTTYFNNLTPGPYYIKTAAYSGYGAYTIANNFIPARFENDPEPNDSIQTAKNITVNTSITGHLGYYNRGNIDYHDYFSFTTTAVWDTLFIRTDSDPTLEIDLNLFNVSYAQIGHSGANGTSELLIQTNLQPGKYYIDVLNWSGYGSYGIIATNIRPTASLVSVENKTVDLVLKEFDLKQNYPNPFNPTTTIAFSVPERSAVSLKVYDLLGREVATLINNEIVAVGNHSKQWNAINYPSGVYFYRLQASKTSGGQTGTFTETRKLILLR